jgi:hypothetical protein
MSAKSCENCKIIMGNYADLWLVHTQVVSQLKGAILELRGLKACSSLLGACTSCPMLISDLEACAIKLLILLIIVFYPLRAMHVTLSRVSFFVLPNRTPS